MMLPKSAWALSGAGTLAALHVGAVSALWQYTRPGVLVGVASHMGSRAIFLLEGWLKARFPQ